MSCLRKYYFLALMAIEFLMSFTFLGYVHIEPISITIAYLPMLIAGCFLGVGPSAAMGLFFGLASMYKASANYVMPMDKLFSPFFSGAPVAQSGDQRRRSRAVRLAGGRCSFCSEGARAIPGSGPGSSRRSRPGCIPCWSIRRWACCFRNWAMGPRTLSAWA